MAFRCEDCGTSYRDPKHAGWHFFFNCWCGGILVYDGSEPLKFNLRTIYDPEDPDARETKVQRNERNRKRRIKKKVKKERKRERRKS